MVWPHVVHCIFGLERGVGRKLDYGPIDVSIKCQDKELETRQWRGDRRSDSKLCNFKKKKSGQRDREGDRC